MKLTEDSPSERLVCVRDFEKAALRILDKDTGEYFRSGADDEVTLKDNSKAFLRWKIIPRYLVDVSRISTTTFVLGKPVSIPIGLSPTAFQKVAHPKGELATARAAQSQGTIYCQSLLSTTSFSEVGAVTPGLRRWAQMYMMKEKAVTESIIRRAENAGVEALVITIDGPYYGRKRTCLRSSFELPSHIRLPNVDPDAENLNYEKMVAFSDDVKNSATWDDIKWIKRITALPVILKGIMTPEDAELAVEANVDAIWVSNHGGRQLDTILPTIDALPDVVRAVGGRCEVYMDGGINRGSDVMKALALGANMVFCGRAPVWGLATGGEQGVRQVLEILKEELELSMGLSGKTSVDQLSRSMLLHQSPSS